MVILGGWLFLVSEVPKHILLLPNPYVLMIPNPKPYTELDSPHEAER